MGQGRVREGVRKGLTYKLYTPLLRILNTKMLIAKVQNEMGYGTIGAVVKIKFEITGQTSILVAHWLILAVVLSLYIFSILCNF